MTINLIPEAHLTLMLEQNVVLTGTRELRPVTFTIRDDGVSFHHGASGATILFTLSDLGKLMEGLKKFRERKQ